jgi:hypothetical protein
MLVTEVFNTQVRTEHGDLTFYDAYVSFNVTNRGQGTIKYFSVTQTIIGP